MALHLLAHPVLLAGGAAALGLLGLGGYKLMQKSKATAALTDAEKKRNAVLTAAYLAGKKDGAADATADSGKVHNPRPITNFSADVKVQQQFENGYNDEYEKLWVAPAVVPDVVPDAPPMPGGSKGMSVYKYGESRGLSAAEVGAHGAAGAGTFAAGAWACGPLRPSGGGVAAFSAIAQRIGAEHAGIDVIIGIGPERIIGVGIEGVVDEIGIGIGPEQWADPADDEH